MTVLQVRNLNKSFGRRHIIKDLSFDLNEGEVLGFIGPNGSGKTTTIKMIMGFLHSDSGEIIINGVNVRKDYEKAMARIGGIVENPEMYTYLSGRKNLQMYARIHDGVPEERIDEVLNLVGMSARADEKVKSYSLGMKQRIGLALALVHSPNILILDEPTNGLDPEGIKDLRSILKRLAHEKGCAIMVSSHLLSEMELMCDRVIIINNGEVQGERTIGEEVSAAADAESKGTEEFKYFFETPDAKRAEEILSTSICKVLYVGTEGITLGAEKDAVPEIIKELVTGGVALTEVRRVHSSLEDEFINITRGGSING